MKAGSIKIAILAGGKGTRLGNLTRDTPKSMVEVAGKPFITHQLELLREKGITDVVLCVGHLGKQIEEFVGDGSRFDLNVEYSYDSRDIEYASDKSTALGTGGALYNALPLLGNTFWVIYGDSYLDIDFSPILEYFNYNHNLYGYGGLITKTSDNIDYGLYVYTKEIFNIYSVIRHHKKEFSLSNLNAVCSNTILKYEIKKRFYEIGSLQGLKETEEFIRSKKNEQN